MRREAVPTKGTPVRTLRMATRIWTQASLWMCAAAPVVWPVRFGFPHILGKPCQARRSGLPTALYEISAWALLSSGDTVEVPLLLLATIQIMPGPQYQLPGNELERMGNKLVVIADSSSIPTSFAAESNLAGPNSTQSDSADDISNSQESGEADAIYHRPLSRTVFAACEGPMSALREHGENTWKDRPCFDSRVDGSVLAGCLTSDSLQSICWVTKHPTLHPHCILLCPIISFSSSKQANARRGGSWLHRHDLFCCAGVVTLDGTTDTVALAHQHFQGSDAQYWPPVNTGRRANAGSSVGNKDDYDDDDVDTLSVAKRVHNLCFHVP
ncbi:hypothetical protein BCR44DRAFT_403916 [Catenaria anguillulae PL171]|uniref:Uncharacterized protein n=1 Tax=Catenaria anguillulae PL171 TaxID=765915 RepID=A0A1Y2HMW7_9FUNG|nr:hypothetical protein BCR44DRAFT_403916 [Catenaria anguillulae PL171]